MESIYLESISFLNHCKSSLSIRRSRLKQTLAKSSSFQPHRLFHQNSTPTLHHTIQTTNCLWKVVLKHLLFTLLFNLKFNLLKQLKAHTSRSNMHTHSNYSYIHFWFLLRFFLLIVVNKCRICMEVWHNISLVEFFCFANFTMNWTMRTTHSTKATGKRIWNVKMKTTETTTRITSKQTCRKKVATETERIDCHSGLSGSVWRQFVLV